MAHYIKGLLLRYTCFERRTKIVTLISYILGFEVRIPETSNRNLCPNHVPPPDAKLTRQSISR